MEERFLIRSVQEGDLDDLYRLSKLVYFINLPEDRTIIRSKIETSINSFSGALEDKFAREYIFVMEDLAERQVIGTSMIIARHGSPKEPHMYFRLSEVQKYSETIHSGIIHKVLQLRFDHDGPTEIGGLVIDPAYRGHRSKLGRQLSFSRFLYIKMRRRWFKDRIISELMPPLTSNGESVLWEAVGRRFTNLSYKEADILSRKNKEFITSLFPKGDIYTCLLPGEVRDAIGKVGKETEPVRHLLEKIGFRWRNDIDPFDGGPHYWAMTDKVSIIHDSRRVHFANEPLKGRTKEIGLCGILSNEGDFHCVQTPYSLSGNTLAVPRERLEVLQPTEGDSIYIMPIV